MPDGIHVEVVEEQPAALVILDKPYLANKEGKLFKVANLQRGDGDSLVAITGLSREFVGERAEAAQVIVKTALDTIAEWNKASHRPALSEVHVSDAGYQLVTLHEGARISLGRVLGEELAARLQRFDLVWSNLSEDERNSATRFHLDSMTRPDRITVGLSMR